MRDGRYVISGTLGAGSQGETLDAVDKREGRPVAIKRFTLRGAKSWKDVELAEREATVLASLNHPGLPRYIEHFEENGALYLVMEKIEGETLYARRKRGATLDQEQVLRFLREAGTCLRYLHSQAPPVVHRDIKPGNVILRPDGSYCLVDFGSVRDRLKPEGGSTVVGTFGFMAPEQFQGRAGPGSDVYAVGATALSLLTGREPEDLPHKGLGVDVESALRGQLDRRLVVVLRNMLEPDPDKRARSVEEALRAAGLSDDAPGRTRYSPPPQAQAGSAAEAKAARRERLREQQDEDHHHYANRAERRARKFAEREERRARKFGQMVEERVRKKAERAARRAERHFQRDWHRPGPPVPPGRALGLVILIALRIASVATFALFGVLLPILFSIIYIPRTRQRMLEINEAGQRGLGRAREHIRYQFMGGQIPHELEQFLRDRDLDPERGGPFARDEGPFADHAASPAPRQRISVDTEAEDLADDDPELEERADPKRAKR
ncbi:MAG TPA: serine/threonine-protein kinase [Polyangiaceae bacterium]|nr:serine/threonine-protein kinase [Polyangiaceae bacterium]